jgi:hypothetical protein
METGINFDSQWNMATAYFYRMHVELAMSNHFGSIGDYRNQYMRLFNLHKELSGQMKPDELNHCEQLESVCKTLVFAKDVSIEIVRDSLYKYEIYMRQIMKDRKMDLPRSKNPGTAILGGDEQ